MKNYILIILVLIFEIIILYATAIASFAFTTFCAKAAKYIADYSKKLVLIFSVLFNYHLSLIVG